MQRIKKFAVAVVLLASAAISGFLLLLIAIPTPDLERFSERRVVQSTKIYDRTGEVLLYDIHGEEKRTVIPFADIPRHVKNAAIALEDDRFYNHYGFRPTSMLRALANNLLRGSFEQGGSTITQQVVKNILLTREKTFVRKAKEVIMAVKLERRYSKDEILNVYLNQIPYGSNAYGIEAAAETFFGKHAIDLTMRETAYLVSLPRAPSYYSPYGKHRKELDARASFTLNKMRNLNFVTPQEYEAAEREQIVFSRAVTQGIVAPHFVIEVRDEINKRFGEEEVERGGFKVITTLDLPLQAKAEEIVSRFALEIEKNFNAHNAAVVAIDPKTGSVLATVGSRDYFDVQNEGNFNIATALRQPGSAFKPFVYATAFKKGFTPETSLFDLPTEFNPSCTADGKPPQPVPDGEKDPCYHPQNFDEKFRGPVSLREALAQSLNVPSVKVLYLAGLEDALGTAKDFGITSLNDPQRYGLTLVLGGGEVSLLELTSAFGVFANSGIRNQPRYIISVENADGEVVFRTDNQPSEVIDSNIAHTINDILSDNTARTPAFGEFSALYFPGARVAAKTGTTNDFRDAWVFGYTPNVVIGAWAGNNNNTPMEKRVAGFIIAPLWHEIFEYALSNFPQESFLSPNHFPNDKPWLRGEWRGGLEYEIDKVSGKLATSYTPIELREKKVVRETHSILYWLGRQNEAQSKNWETPIRKWALDNNLYDQDSSVIPTVYDDVHVPENLPKIKNIEVLPKKNIYKLGERIMVELEVESKYSIAQVDFFAGREEDYVGSVKNRPFSINMEATGAVKMKVYDAVGNKTEENVVLPVE